MSNQARPALTPEQRKLILQRLQKKDAAQAQILPRANEIDAFPLSFAQQRLWFLDQMGPGSVAYLIARVEHLLEDLSMEALERSLDTLVRRHEALRTTFEERDGQPVQVIHAKSRSAFSLIDLQGLTQEQREKAAQRLISQEAQHPCNLTKGPLLRPSVVRMGKQEHVVLLTLHHIITDGWSNDILARELFTLYRAYSAGHAAALAPLPIQYTDYALWQQRWLQGERLEKQLAYWRKQLADVPPLALPTDHARPAVQTLRGATQTRLVPAEILEQLQTLSQQEGVTMFMLLLAAFQVLLLRYTGQSDISVGIPIANRTRAEIAGVVGLFVNTLVMRGDLAGNPTFQQFLSGVREVALQAYAHQDVPFEKVVEVLQPERDLSRSPLFQVMLVLQEGAAKQREPETEARLLQPASSSKFDLTLSLTPTAAGLRSALEYNTDLFEPGTIGRILNHWQILLQSITQAPHLRLVELPLLAPDERERMLRAWNATQAAYPEHLCLHDLFEQQAARTPDAVAIESGEEQLTYDQLRKRTNQVAHYLRRLGVGPDVPVGIGLERSIDLMIGILGILKAGGAYVPLDIAHPKQRLASIAQDANLATLLTTSHLRASLPSTKQVVCLDTDWPSIAQCEREAAPTVTTLPANLAYILYTSGSTGQPKGVMIPHRGVVHYVDWSGKHYAVKQGSGSPVHSPLSFDLTVTSLFPALSVGRRLVLVPEAPGIEALGQILAQRNDFSLLKITPAHLNLLDQLLTPEQLSTAAQALIIGGEALHSESVRAWREHAPATRLINEYGPTETVVGCCIYEIPRDKKYVGAVPIGRPIPNTQLYLLDVHLQPVPPGVPGELYIGGVGVARGYLHRPELTAERFIPDPFGTEPGARLYRTGDVARSISADGTLEYLGRVDHQVKLRGYRIELAEIEAVLRQHPQVADCTVLLQEEGPAAPRLIGYVVARDAAVLTSVILDEMLDEMLREHLPAYMVPSMLITVDELPLTSNGKVDRRHLLKLAQVRGDVVSVQSEPRGPVEDVLLKMWSELLAVPLPGIHDNFFAVGGHSLLATRLIAQIRAIFQIELPVRAVFEGPTVAALAKQVRRALEQNGEQEIPPLVAVARSDAMPLSFAQQRLWFLDRLQPGNSAYLVARSRSFSGPLHVRALERSLEELVCRHESLRTTFALRSGQPVQVIHPAASYRLPLIDLRGLAGETRRAEGRRLSWLEARHPCDLEQGPLVRTYLVRLDDEEHVLLMTLHHIITDGRSNEILVDELVTLYQSCIAGQPAPLAPLPIQYVDYAVWQRQWLQGKLLETQLDYWIRQLGGVQPIELPIDHPRPSLVSSRGALHPFALSEELSQAVIALGREEKVTLFMTLLAAFQVLCYRYSGQTDLVVGTDVANRTHGEMEGIVGFFINLLALRVDLSGNPSFREVLRRVRSVVVGAYTHSDTPFELLVEKLAPDHTADQTPLIQALFVMQNMPARVHREADPVAQMENSAVDQQPFQPGMDKETAVKFDVAMFMQEHAGKLLGTLHYRLDLFRASTIATMTARFATLLQSSVRQPDMPIDVLDIISEEERQQNRREGQKQRKKLHIRNDAWIDLPAIDFTKKDDNT
jgi:amino acid adenylation domain-containing protein